VRANCVQDISASAQTFFFSAEKRKQCRKKQRKHSVLSTAPIFKGSSVYIVTDSELNVLGSICDRRMYVFFFNQGCLHPVARVRSDDVGFNPSTQRHYRRLIYYLYIHSYMFRSYGHHQVKNILLP
jgi:hypothetical protein